MLEAHSLFEVSTVGNGGAGAPETLEIAQIKGTVCVDTENEVRRSLLCCSRAALLVAVAGIIPFIALAANRKRSAHTALRHRTYVGYIKVGA